MVAEIVVPIVFAVVLSFCGTVVFLINYIKSIYKELETKIDFLKKEKSPPEDDDLSEA